MSKIVITILFLGNILMAGTILYIEVNGSKIPIIYE